MGDNMSNALDHELEEINPEAFASLRRMIATHAARVAAGDTQPTEPRPPAKIIQLPLWAEPVRGMPNPALRSALFSAVQSKDRRFINYEKIAAVSGVEIRFKGEQLNQEDLEVCAEVFHLARLHPLGHTCRTAAHALLKALGRSTGRTNHRQLHASLIRLQQPLELKVLGLSYSNPLIEKVIKDEVSRRYLIKVNAELAPLFHNGWTALDAEQRRKLRGKPLALWLHAFYATHAEPYPYKVETLRQLCGSRTTALFHYRTQLRRALAELQAAGGIAGWEIDCDDLVHAHKVPTIICRRRKAPNN
jgi:hypothetical protein